MRRKLLPFCSIIPMLIYSISFAVVFNNKKEEFVLTNAKELQTGQLSVYLFYYTYGGSNNRYKEFADNKMIYNSSSKCYSIDVVLFDGDYFVPNITGQGIVNYSSKLSEKTIEELMSQNISMHVGGNQFHVNKSGTYRISISAHIESYVNKDDFYKIWEDDDSGIIYLSESTRYSEPIGTNNLYLLGNFDGIGWDGSRQPERAFSFENSSSNYVFYYNLYEGDIFCIESAERGRIFYYSSEYADDMFNNNHIGRANDGYFVCKKDGYYKFAIDYSVEYLYSLPYLWDENIGSTISYLGALKPPSIKGNESIILTGKVGGYDLLSTSKSYRFNYNPATIQYKLTAFFSVGDYFRPYLQNKGKNVYCRINSSYLKNMCDGINVEFVTISNIPSFSINKSGYYEIAIGANVENLREESYCWLPHGDSYIRYLGNNVNSIYVTSNEYLDKKCNVYANGDNDIQQYGLDGIDIKSVNYITLNSGDAKGYFFKVEYDSTYTNSINIKNTKNDEEKLLTISPESSQSYDFESGSKNIYLGNACAFLTKLSNYFDGIKCEDGFAADYSKISADQAKQVIDQYNALDSNSKKYVDEALIATSDNYGKKTNIHFMDIMPFLRSIINKQKNEERTLIIVYIVGGLALSIIVGFVALSFKRARSNKKPLPLDSDKEQESTHITI